MKHGMSPREWRADGHNQTTKVLAHGRHSGASGNPCHDTQVRCAPVDAAFAGMTGKGESLAAWYHLCRTARSSYAGCIALARLSRASTLQAPAPNAVRSRKPP